MTSRAVVVLIALLVLGSASGASAQILSPGELAGAHVELEGLRQCTTCHQLGQRGISPERCLACHTPLAERIEAALGFHASVPGESCADCHKDHLGRDFDLLHLDVAEFLHEETGYDLEGSHESVDCAECHTREHVTDPAVVAFKSEHGALDRTYLGVSQLCVGCHEDNSPHEEQFQDRSCDACHDPSSWEDVPAFDHAESDYPLVGRHAQVECGDCHVPSGDFVAYAPLEYGSCNSCHESESPHRGQFAGQGCEDCHDPQRWDEAPGFDHGPTSYPLEGRHAQVACGDCHVPSGGFVRYRPLEHGTCDACHEDVHSGGMSGACVDCHQTTGWRAVANSDLEDVFDHSTTPFPLVGAHADASCNACHIRGRPPLSEAVRITYRAGTQDYTFPRPLSDDCGACHLEYHPATGDSVVGSDCADCHSEARWAPTTYGVDLHNSETAFPLTGAHLVTPCVACHVGPTAGGSTGRFELSVERTDCAACHSVDDPHDGVFGSRACDDCHQTEDFQVESFDHEASGVGVGTQPCTTCHAEDDPHQGQFRGQPCSACHLTTGYTVADFDHSSTAFPLEGAHESIDCSSCHLPEVAIDGRSFIRYIPLGSECTDCHGAGL